MERLSIDAILKEAYSKRGELATYEKEHKLSVEREKKAIIAYINSVILNPFYSSEHVNTEEFSVKKEKGYFEGYLKEDNNIVFFKTNAEKGKPVLLEVYVEKKLEAKYADCPVHYQVFPYRVALNIFTGKAAKAEVQEPFVSYDIGENYGPDRLYSVGKEYAEFRKTVKEPIMESQKKLTNTNKR